ncbi:Fur family transcriptional regulator [Candidatus Hepatobacter penaei]|uniref:Fur family transcriptional regulator n=1 Tax=Candidatus Hepatobacter penaei TaxID=1274402 RepID=UPI0009E2D982|nr:Fur family transcriptional regulator [Candidatus Hepatobacter penaei]TGW15456.1 transcriptional repressor [bacterium NHP-B]
MLASWYDRLKDGCEANRVSDSFEKALEAKGVQVTRARRLIARILCASNDHPDVQCLHRRVVKEDASISIATIYRTLKLFRDLGLLERHMFGSDTARYEPVSEDKHDHLVDIESNEVIEFQDEDINRMTQKIAESLGYHLVDHRIELYGFPIDKAKNAR